MAHVIDSHDCKIDFKNNLVAIYLQATLSLVENQDATFEFCVNYSYVGTFGGSGYICVPVNGNEVAENNEGRGLLISYEISNWNLTEHHVSCDLSVDAIYKPMQIGPESLISKQHFSGSRLSVSKIEP